MNGKNFTCNESTNKRKMKIKRHQFVPSKQEFQSKSEMYRFWAFIAGLAFPGYHIGLNTLITSVIGDNSIDTMLAYVILLGAFFMAFLHTSRKKWQHYLKPIIYMVLLVIVLFGFSELIWAKNATVLVRMRTTFFQTVCWGGVAFNMLEDKNLIKKALRLIGYIIFVFLVFEPFATQSTLFVENDSSWGDSGYLTWGYRMLIAAILLIFAAFETKKKCDIICAITASLEVLLIGNRGSTVAIFCFIALYVLFCTKNVRKVKYVVIFSCIVCICISLFSVNTLVDMEVVLESVGIRSRNITKILDNTFIESGRDEGYDIAIEQILHGNNWIGLGVGGDQVLVGNYPHNIILELLLQYGNIIGVVLSVVLIYKTVRIFVFCKDKSWKSIFIACFCISIIKLWFSSTYWYELWFWAYLVVLGKIGRQMKYKKRLIQNHIPLEVNKYENNETSM